MASKRFMSPQAGQEHPNIYQLLMQMPSQQQNDVKLKESWMRYAKPRQQNIPIVAKQRLQALYVLLQLAGLLASKVRVCARLMWVVLSFCAVALFWLFALLYWNSSYAFIFVFLMNFFISFCSPPLYSSLSLDDGDRRCCQVCACSWQMRLRGMLACFIACAPYDQFLFLFYYLSPLR